MANINTVLQNFLTQQGIDDLAAEYIKNSDSYYQYNKNKVVLGGLTNKLADDLFMDYCKELGLTVPMHVEAMSFLHEVGHHMTLDFLDEDELFESTMIKLSVCVKEEDEYTEEDYRTYMTCAVEYEATWDAVKFCNACPEVALKLDNDILNALYGA